ncbi:unnamed protein product [Allacma fusca]|uniref:Uncharacterized protein n=1 Tax=Allacma fusca TaxID=39272 RepID=A0A8J2JR45_9HEXA|nr:unnamed protein product [Allacma fusca]
MARVAQYVLLVTVLALVLNLTMAAPSNSEDTGSAEEERVPCGDGCQNGTWDEYCKCNCNQGYVHPSDNNLLCIAIAVNVGKW